MKQIIVWILFYIGDLISKTFFYRKCGVGYKLYCKIMLKSMDLQDKWKLKQPWEHIDDLI